MDVGDSQQKMISILVKTPNQAQEDRTVHGVYVTWTVKDLKTHLSTAYPAKPAVADQRLIYGGKLLPDYLHIKDIFRQTDSIPTLHLVLAVRKSLHETMGARPKTKEDTHSSPSRPVSVSPTTSSAAQTPITPELRQRRPTQNPVPPPGPPAWPDAQIPGAQAMPQPTFPTYSLYSPQQLLWLQHVYARQYYMQYQAALAAAGTAPSAPTATVGQYPPVPAHQVPVPAPLANQNPIDNLPPNQNPVQDGAFINAGNANQDMRMNAQGGPVMEDEEDMERDWLDWFYSAARFGVLLMIVYFNSNLSRFLLVMSALFLMYLHTVGWFPFRRRVQVQVPNPPPEPDNRNPNPNPADGPAAAEPSEHPGPMAAVVVPPHRASLVWTAWVFFKTFFSSLIPETPQGMAN